MHGAIDRFKVTTVKYRVYKKNKYFVTNRSLKIKSIKLSNTIISHFTLNTRMIMFSKKYIWYRILLKITLKILWSTNCTTRVLP